jgi:hypothetical protein
MVVVVATVVKGEGVVLAPTNHAVVRISRRPWWKVCLSLTSKQARVCQAPKRGGASSSPPPPHTHTFTHGWQWGGRNGTVCAAKLR